jgi:hypothetical protein
MNRAIQPLARRNPFPGSDCENGDGSPNDIHKCGGIRTIKDCVCSQKKTAAHIKELKRRGVSFPFPGGDHRVCHKQSDCADPSNSVKPKMIIHIEQFLNPSRTCLRHVERSRDIPRHNLSPVPRHLIRSLPVRSASGLPVHVAASAAAPLSTSLGMTFMPPIF